MSKIIKTLVCSLAFAFTIPTLNAQVKNDSKEGKQNKSSEKVEESASCKSVKDLALAHHLAEYGRTNNSIEALITAITILSSTQTKKSENKKTSTTMSQKASDVKKTKSENPSNIDIIKLVEDAKRMANGDANMLAQIDKAAIADKSRGALGGASITYETVNAKTSDSYSVYFRGSESAIIYVEGDGDTDLDLFVYDENGNLIDEDTDYGDECLIDFIPKWTGKFNVVVKNLGDVYNDYSLETN